MTAMNQSPLRKLVAGVAIAATIGLGALALGSVLPAGAQTGPSTPAAAGARAGKAKAALDKLVTDGTITQAQEDAVIAAVRTNGARPDGSRLRRLVDTVLSVSADKIGVTPDALRAELQAGKSIADVAGEHNVNVDDVKTALIAAGTAKVQQGVSAGFIKQDRADQIIAKLPTLADTVVNRHKTAKAPGG
jgi:hypothetical protein